MPPCYVLAQQPQILAWVPEDATSFMLRALWLHLRVEASLGS